MNSAPAQHWSSTVPFIETRWGTGIMVGLFILFVIEKILLTALDEKGYRMRRKK